MNRMGHLVKREEFVSDVLVRASNDLEDDNLYASDLLLDLVGLDAGGESIVLAFVGKCLHTPVVVRCVVELCRVGIEPCMEEIDGTNCHDTIVSIGHRRRYCP